MLFATVDPYAIFERAREVWASQRYPAVVSYTVDVAARNHGSIQHRHYHEYWSSSDRSVVVKPPVSDEQLNDPYRPPAGVGFYGLNIGGPRVGTGVRDFIGFRCSRPTTASASARTCRPRSSHPRKS